MIKSITRFEHKVGERIYHFLCDSDSPIGEVHDALMHMKATVIEKINAVHEAETKPKE